MTKVRPMRLAINGLGRIGRVFLRVASDNPLLNIVAANSRSDAAMYAHLLKYDSVYGTWDKSVTGKANKLFVDGRSILFFQEPDGPKLPWGKLKIDAVIDATGKNRRRREAVAHLLAGAKFVAVTHPGDGMDGTFVMGVNEREFDFKRHKVFSVASCTSVCSALVAKVLEENFGIARGFINTVHAFTNDQNLHDSAHADLRRARAATQSIIPTTTGVTKTLASFFPKLEGRFSGLSLRVPVIDPSVLCFTAQLKQPVTARAVNKAFIKASQNELKGNLAVSNLPLVSRDYRQNPHGAIIDLLSTEVVDKTLVNVVAWYDNEWGYVTQLTRLLEYLAKKI